MLLVLLLLEEGGERREFLSPLSSPPPPPNPHHCQLFSSSILRCQIRRNWKPFSPSPGVFFCTVLYYSTPQEALRKEMSTTEEQLGVEILLDRANRTFRKGETLSGKVVVRAPGKREFKCSGGF